VLLGLREASNRTLALLVLASLLYPYLARAAWQAGSLPLPQRPETEGMAYWASNFLWVRYWYSGAILNWPGMLPLFLFGLYFGRRPLRDWIGDDRRNRRALAAGVGITVAALVTRELLSRAWADSPPLVGRQMAVGLLWTLHAWSLAAVYALSLVLILRKSSWRRWLAPVGALGRMALTNYVLQAVLIVPICIAFDLFDRVTPGLGFLLAAAAAAVQIPTSVWWLARYRFGPLEWIWRSLTYGRRQPMRAADRSLVAVGG
jgi:uncharacterized protein